MKGSKEQHENKQVRIELTNSRTQSEHSAGETLSEVPNPERLYTG